MVEGFALGFGWLIFLGLLWLITRGMLTGRR